MDVEQRIAALKDEAYAAAFDIRLWTPWASRVSALLGGACSVFSVVDSLDGTVCAQTIEHDDAAVIDRYYREGMHLLDPQVARVRQLSRYTIYTDVETLDLSDPDNLAHTRWTRDNAGIRHYLSAVTLLGNGRYVGALSIHRARNEGVVPPEWQRIVHALFPHFSRALQLGMTHGEKATAAFWDGMDAKAAEPALLLDRTGRMIRATAAAEALFRAGDGLDVRAGRLGGRTPADTDRLDRAVSSAVARTGAQATAVRASRSSGRLPYIVTCYPLNAQDMLVPDLAPAALVTIVDPAAAPATDGGVRMQAFGLTAREDELAALLMAGHSVETASATLGIAVATARIHLRRLLAKTGTARQIDLVRLLLRVSTKRGGPGAAPVIQMDDS